jgi:hypothetical protein
MKIIIQSPVFHDGKLLGEGDEVDMQKADAEALIDCGAASLPAGKKSAKADKAEAPVADEAAGDEQPEA